MKLSTKGRYGLRTMIDLASHEEEGAGVHCQHFRTPEYLREHLEQLVRPLRKAGFIESVRGAGGGYVLTAKPADSISVGDVLRVLEGGLEAVTCSVNEGLGGCDAADFCVTRFVWQRINEGITNAVDSISLGEGLVQQSRQLEKNRNSDRNDKGVNNNDLSGQCGNNKNSPGIVE